jgi:hypothetical protein
MTRLVEIIGKIDDRIDSESRQAADAARCRTSRKPKLMAGQVAAVTLD